MIRACQRLLVLLFLGAISLPLAANLAGFDGGDQGAENRELSPFPRFGGSVPALPALATGLSDWFSDHFGFRSTLVRWHAESRLFVLGVSPTTTVIAGRNQWFLYGDDGAVEDYSRVAPMTTAAVEGWRETLTRTERWLRARGIAYVFTIAPDKHVIYPEAMPAAVRRITDVSRTDQVFAGLAGSGVSAVDVRPALMAARDRERVYQRTDTHWNDRGAFAAYGQLIAAVRQQVPAVPPAWTRDDFESVERTVESMDLAGMMGLKRVMQEVDLALVPRHPRRARVVEPAASATPFEDGRVVTEIPGSPLPRAVIFRDSFASRLGPLLSEHFSRAVYLWQNDFDADAVEREHPDVVIQEIVGRHLYNFIPSPELVPR